jgi:hypothetical protein
MLTDPIVMILWGLAPATIVFGLSLLSERVTLTIPMRHEQPWACRALSLVLVFAMGAPFVVAFPPSVRILAYFFEGRPWLFQGLLCTLQGIQVVPVVLLVRRYHRPFFRSVGITRDRATWQAASVQLGRRFARGTVTVLPSGNRTSATRTFASTGGRPLVFLWGYARYEPLMVDRGRRDRNRRQRYGGCVR